MPEFTIKEVRLPELHFPEIKRDEIVRALSGARLSDVDLANLGRARIKVPAITRADAGKLLAAAAAVVRFVGPTPRRGRWLRYPFGRSRSPVRLIVRPRGRRSGWPLAIGVFVVAAIGIWALLRLPPVRRRVDVASHRARERIDVMRTPEIGPEAVDAEPSVETADEQVANVAETVDPSVFEESRSPS